MKCSRCQQDNPVADAQFCPRCGAPAKYPKERSTPAASYADLQRELTKALEQQTVTSDLLKVIGRSTFDLQPVFEMLAENAVRLCDAERALIFRFDGQLLRIVVAYNASHELRAFIEQNPIAPGRHSAAARAALERRTIHIHDVRADPEYSYGAIQVDPVRTLLGVPILRADELLGVIIIYRQELLPFTDSHIVLMETFADQAAIAIENVRLFTELKASNRHLTESLEQQTATSEILRVISSSPTEVQPVFDAIASSALRLCDGIASFVFRHDGSLIHLAAVDSVEGVDLEPLRHIFPAPPDQVTFVGRAVAAGRLLYIADIDNDRDAPPSLVEFARANGFRSIIAAPMLRHGHTIGGIGVTHRNIDGFTSQQGALLQTFADQAVIAIENARLFTELQEKNDALTQAHAQVTESLEQQTATAEILRVISSSPTDVQPVFDTIVQSAVRLCGAATGALFREDRGMVELSAHHNFTDAARAVMERFFPAPLESPLPAVKVIRSGEAIHVADVLTDPGAASGARPVGETLGFRNLLVVPMLRRDRAIGAIAVARRVAELFSDSQVELLKTFADQAVIAIENVRLFTELQARTGELTRSVGELRALGEVSQALSSTLDVDIVLDTIVTRANDLIGADGCTIFEYDEVTEQFHLRATRNLEPRLVELARGTPLRKGDQGILGQLPMGRQAVQVPDITAGSYSSPISDALIEAGYRAVVAVPLIREDHLIGALTMNRKTPGEFPAETIELLQTFATQSALAIQNARLFREIEQKSRELEAASRHKSEFLANMSHELRTPLNAVIGFSEVLTERMFGELNEKQEEYLKDIHASGQHLLSLINDILDLSKIEAGKMDLEPSEFDLAMTIDNALMLVRERAARRSIALNTAVDERVGQIQADERKIRQVLLNLLSNAIKFTPEGGRIHVEARSVNESVEVSVTDTGIGIAPEDQEAVFEEFRQVGTAEKKVEGTGLGLALSRKFIELHGGKMWVESQVGEGSTFTFTVPVRRGE